MRCLYTFKKYNNISAVGLIIQPCAYMYYDDVNMYPVPVLPQYLHGPKYLSNFKIAEFQNPMQRCCAPDFRRSAGTVMGTVGAQDTPWPDPARICSESVEYRLHLHAAFGSCACLKMTRSKLTRI